MLELLGILRDQLRRIGGNCPMPCADPDQMSPPGPAKIWNCPGGGGPGFAAPGSPCLADSVASLPPFGPALRLQLDFQEYDFAGSLVEHVVLDARFAKVRFAGAELRLGALAIGRHDRHLARGDRHDDV